MHPFVWCELRNPTGFPKTEVHLSFSNMIEQSLQRFPLTTTSIQKLGKMGLLKVLTKKCLGQDSATVKKSSQLQAFDELTPEDKLEVLDEQLRILERCAKVNFDYFSLEEERAIRLLMVNPH